MASPAASKYKALATYASVILKADRSELPRPDVQALYGAVFVAQVAAWNAFLVELINCFFQRSSNPLNPSFNALHGLAREAAARQLDRFNTPNAENTRNLLLWCTGYDPWPDWQWPTRNLNAIAMRTRLNEILKVRHSLAHGSTMPGFQWNQLPSGEIRISLRIIIWTRLFFNQLVNTTDRGVSAHLMAVYGVATGW